jgi:hypothetical protein
MIKNYQDIEEPLKIIFNSNGSGSTLTIWDQYFIGDMDYHSVERFVQVFLSIRALSKVNVYIDDYKLNRDSKKPDCLGAIRRLSELLNLNDISLSVFDYYSRRDRNNRIHGRYWLSGNACFFMDGSVSGIGKNLCIADVLDEDMFGKIFPILEEKKCAYCKEINIQTFQPNYYGSLAGKRLRF